MTQAQLAKRMGMSQQSAAALEADETSGTMTLARLQRAADSLGCELRYVLVPKKPLEKMISDQAHRRAEQKLGRVNRSHALEASAVAANSLASTVADLAKELELGRSSDLWDD